MTKQNIQENLVKLFLRLNGYFTTGLIIHSSTFGSNQTELDSVAVRFPFHTQPDRLIDCCQYLQIPKKTIDIIIGEVKSGNEKIQFNKALRNNENSLEKLVDWLGLFDDDEKTIVVNKLKSAIKPKEKNIPDNFPTIIFQGKSGFYSIRLIIFSLDKSEPSHNQPRFVFGQLMLDFIWDCFRPQNIRESCSTTYNLNMWGHSLLPIVEYFKDKNKESVGTMKDYYKHFGF
jgi:hypothetical protein